MTASPTDAKNNVSFLDPRAAPTLPVDPYASKSLDPSKPATIALLANGFPDSIAFLDQVELALMKVMPANTSIRRYAKPNASAPMTPQLLESLTSDCDAAIGAYGH